MFSPPTWIRKEHSRYLSVPHRTPPPPFRCSGVVSMQWWWLQVGGVLKKKGNIHTEDTTSHGENKKEKKKKRCRLSNSRTLIGQSDGFTPYATAAWIRKEHSRYLSVPHLISAGWYQVHTYLVHNTYLTKTNISRTYAQIFFLDVAIRNSLRSN